MGLPAQERFTLQDLADRWGTTLHHVEEMVCNLKFNHIIVEDEIIKNGNPLTRHLYFDRALFRRDNPEQPAVLSNKAKKILIKQLQVLEAKRLKDEALAKYPKDEVLAKARTREIARIRNGEREEQTYHNLGPDEVANLWQPFPPSQQWARPNKEVTVYIPREVAEAFEETHALHKGAASSSPVLSHQVLSPPVRPINMQQLDLSKMSESLRIAIMADIRLYSEGVIRPNRGDRAQIDDWLEKEHPQLSANTRKLIVSVVNRRKGGAPRSPRFDEK